MQRLGRGSPFRSLARLTIRTKTFTASAVVLICLIGMAVTVQLTSSQVASSKRTTPQAGWPSPNVRRIALRAITR